MSRYRFDLATSADDADLRQILKLTAMPGRVAITLRREPSYFAAAAVEGQFRQVVVARDEQTGRVVGFGSRSIRHVFINAQIGQVGYLGSLRLLPAHRNIGLVARGFKHFRQLHHDGRASLYLTTIADGNQRAQQTLVGARAGIPAYHDIGCYKTAVLTPRRSRQPSHLLVRRATKHDLPAIVVFLSAYGPARQFFPSYTIEDFQSESGLLQGLRCEDILLAIENDQLVGTLALWNQQPFRQSVVESYSGATRWARPWYNCWAALRRSAKLPLPGQSFPYLTAALPLVANERTAVMRQLLDVALNELAAHNGPPLLFGLHAADPLFEVLESFRPHGYSTNVHLVCWEDGEAERRAIDGRPPYLELGSL